MSRDELDDENNPKKFCLQKIVEVASLNMNRVRFHWQGIWRTMGEHFTWVGSHKNLHVVIYAVDSLRQLADKFLEIDERKNFGYQKTFLKPFETIMLNNLYSQQKQVKEYIVMCIAALCNHKVKYIKSGWEVILNIFTLAAQDSEAHLVIQSFQSLDYGVKNHFSILSDNFIELVNCIAKFSLSPAHTSQAQELLMICARKLSEDAEIINSHIQNHGHMLYMKDMENMKRIAPKYGIQEYHVIKQGKTQKD